MQVNVLLFGMIKDIAGGNTILLNDVGDTNGIIEQLRLRFPQLHDTKYAIAVNRIVIQTNTKLTENAEVAVLPPFSGG